MSERCSATIEDPDGIAVQCDEPKGHSSGEDTGHWHSRFGIGWTDSVNGTRPDVE